MRAELPALRDSIASLSSESETIRAGAPRIIPVAYGRHLTAVSRYIHLNPVDAGLVWCPEHWPYTSFRAYLGEVGTPRWITTDAVLGRFGLIGARHRHRAYVYAGMDPGSRDADGRPRWSGMLGGGGLAEDLAWRVEPVLATYAVRRSIATPAPSLWQLAHAVATAFDVTAAVLRTVRTGGPLAARARGALVHAARQLRGFRPSDVAAFMGYASPAAAAAAAERFASAVRIDPALRSRIAEAMTRLTLAS